MTNNIKPQPYNTKQLAAVYGVSYRTMRTWLSKMSKQLGKQAGKCWNIKQVKQMFDNLGTPENN